MKDRVGAKVKLRVEELLDELTKAAAIPALVGMLSAAAVGKADAALLESYEQERRPIGLRNTAYARDFADSVGLFEVTPALEADGDEGEGLRTQASEVLNAHVRREFNIPGVTFGERVDASPLVFSEPDQVPLYTNKDDILGEVRACACVCVRACACVRIGEKK